MDSPIVNFLEDEIDNIVAYFLGVEVDYANCYFGIILSKLGFCCEDIINVYKVYNYSEYTDILFRVNEMDDEYRIRMYTYDNVLVINFIMDDKSCEYFCNVDRYGRFEVELDERYPDKEEQEIEIDNLDKEENKNEIEDTKIEVYEELYSSKGYLNYKVVNGDYIIELCFYKYELYYGILNRSEVFEYLSTLSFPVSIFDVYKKICEIARIEDIRWFSYFDLRILKRVDNENIENDYEITDLITLSDGELVSVMTTRNGMQVYSNEDSVWNCDMDNSSVEFVTVKENNSYSFNTRVKFKNESIFNTEYFALEDMMSAKVEVAKVKKLVKDNFNK